MDALRQIRFLIPPFFVFGAIALAAFADPESSSQALQFLKGNSNTLIALVVAGVLPVGFVISSVTILLLKSWYGIQRNAIFKRNAIFQANLTEEEYGQIYVLLVGASTRPEDQETQRNWSASDKLAMIVNFDHGLVRTLFPGVAGWSARTYSAFFVSLSSIVALGIGGAVVVFSTDLDPNWTWWVLMPSLFVILGFGTWMARRDFNNLTRFLVKNYGRMKLMSRIDPQK